MKMAINCERVFLLKIVFFSDAVLETRLFFEENEDYELRGDSAANRERFKTYTLHLAG